MRNYEWILITALALAGVQLISFSSSVAAAISLSEMAQEMAYAENTCGDIVTNGTISIPKNLTKGDCNITVMRNTSSGITTLYFSLISLETGVSLILLDGDGAITTVSGIKEPFTAVVQSQNATLVIRSSDAVNGSILQASIDTSGCQIDSSVVGHTYVQSPLYRTGWQFSCNYTFIKTESSLNSKLALSFLQVSLPNASLIIDNQNTTVTGSDQPADVYSISPLQLTLNVQAVNVSQTFAASLALITSSPDCGIVKDINGSSTVNITVPGVPPFSYDCRFTLRGSQDHSLLLNITDLQLASTRDHLMIFDGPSLGNRVLASLSEAPADYLVLSSGKEVLLRLVRAAQDATGDHRLTLTVLELEGTHHFYDSGSFNMSLPAGEVSGSHYCALEAEAGSVVNFNPFKTTGNGSYILSVYDGLQLSSPLLVTFSASGPNFPVMSTGGSMLIVGHWTNSSQKLMISFSSAKPGCVQVTSKNYGNFELKKPLSSPSSCRWTITTQPEAQGTILLEMTLIQLVSKVSVSIYSGVLEAGQKIAELSPDNTKPATLLPRFAIPASKWAQVVFSADSNTTLTSVDVQASFFVEEECGGSVQESNGHIKSPDYPNLYPLNSACTWTVTKSGSFIYFTFPQFRLATNHQLQITEGQQPSKVMGSYSGMAEIVDLIFPSNMSSLVRFSAPSNVNGSALSVQVEQGFDVQYWILNCGGNMTNSSGTFKSPSPSNNTLCMWIITLPPIGSGNKKNIVSLTLNTEPKTGLPLEVIKVYDGNSIRMPLLNATLNSPNETLSRFNYVIIVFNTSASTSKESVTLSVNYSTHVCEKLCGNGICMHSDWICNGKDDCGDDSDEQNCILPPPVPAPSTAGVKGYVVAILFILGVIIGVIITVVVPRIMRRWRSNRYTSFRNDPTV